MYLPNKDFYVTGQGFSSKSRGSSHVSLLRFQSRRTPSRLQGLERAWRSGTETEYDVIIVGGGNHGLATAYYLAKLHGVANVAVLEKGYLGSGNTGQNTTIVRSNYIAPGNTLFMRSRCGYEGSPKI